MTHDDRQLTDRLRSAYSIEMDDDTRRRQLETIHAALKDAPVPVAAASSAMGRWRRRVATLTVAATVLTPAAVAVAAEGSLPGDLLYPVKQVTEDLRSTIDGTIVARHRLEEADTMLDEGYPVADVDTILEQADAAIAEAGDHPDLRTRLIEVRDRMEMAPAAGTPATGGHDDAPGTPPHGDGTVGDDGEMSGRPGATPGDQAPPMGTPPSDGTVGNAPGTPPHDTPGTDMGTPPADTGTQHGDGADPGDGTGMGTEPGSGSMPPTTHDTVTTTTTPPATTTTTVPPVEGDHTTSTTMPPPMDEGGPPPTTGHGG